MVSDRPLPHTLVVKPGLLLQVAIMQEDLENVAMPASDHRPSS